MASGDRPNTTFLIWSPTRQKGPSSKEQELRRRQYAARIGYTKRRGRGSYAEQASGEGRYRILAPKSVTETAGLLETNSTTEEYEDDLQLEAPLSPSCIDPFDVFCVKRLSGRAQDTLKFSLIHQWPIFAASSKKSDIDDWLLVTGKASLECPSLLNSVVYAGATYQQYFGFRHGATELLRLETHQEILRNIRQEIELSKDDVSQATLLAIAILVFFGSTSSPLKPPISNLPYVRDNHFLSSIEWEPAHVQALLSLTERIGGLSRIRIEPLVRIVSFVDAVYAITSFRKPLFPIFSAAQTSLDSLWTKFDDDTKQKLLALREDCQGFAFLTDLENGRTILEIVSNTLIVLEGYRLFFCEPQCRIDIIDVMASRRVVQHAAVSSEPEGPILYRITRLALIAFTTECLSSIYPGHLVHRSIAPVLLTMLKDCDSLRSYPGVPEFLLWATVLGGFIARGMPLRFRYAELLREGPIEPVHQNWDLIQSLSHRYLPFVFDHEIGCKAFWDEACTYLSQDEFRVDMENSSMTEAAG